MVSCTLVFKLSFLSLYHLSLTGIYIFYMVLCGHYPVNFWILSIFISFNVIPIPFYYNHMHLLNTGYIVIYIALYKFVS